MMLFLSLFAFQLTAVDQFGLPDHPLWVNTQSPCFVGEMDPETRTPRWVGYLLDPATFKGPGDRNKSSWKPLEGVSFSALDAQYDKTLWDRGHLRPAATAGLSQDLMDCTHTFGNAAPQSPRFNRYSWRFLEDDVRKLARFIGVGLEFTGVAYTEYKKSRKTIADTIAIPDFFWKVDLFEYKGELHVAAWLMPNVGLPNDTKAAWYRTSVDRIEKLGEIDLFPNMPKARQKELEARVESSFWDQVWQELKGQLTDDDDDEDEEPEQE